MKAWEGSWAWSQLHGGQLSVWTGAGGWGPMLSGLALDPFQFHPPLWARAGVGVGGGALTSASRAPPFSGHLGLSWQAFVESSRPGPPGAQGKGSHGDGRGLDGVEAPWGLIPFPGTWRERPTPGTLGPCPLPTLPWLPQASCSSPALALSCPALPTDQALPALCCASPPSRHAQAV